jgi:E3 ubiquitin-protein ligase HUWE1
LKSIGLEDLKSYDPQIYQSLNYIANDPNVDFKECDLKFTIMKEDGSEIELIPNGANIPVTKQRRKEYVRRVARHYLLDECRESMKAFLQGFYQVVPKSLISVFDADELSFILQGTP